MPGKLQHGQGKRSSRRKRGKSRQSPSVIAAQRQPVAQAYKPVSRPAVTASSHVPISTLTAVQHPYIVSELRRIGILAGTMLAILVVLALVLS